MKNMFLQRALNSMYLLLVRIIPGAKLVLTYTIE